MTVWHHLSRIPTKNLMGLVGTHDCYSFIAKACFVGILLVVGLMLQTMQREEVMALAFSQDGGVVFGGRKDGSLMIWQLGEQSFHRYAAHSDWVTSLVLSPDGETLVSASEDNTIKVWDVATTELQRTLDGHTDGVSSLAISPDGEAVASGSEDSTVRIWNLHTGKLERALIGHHDGVRTVSFSPQGDMLASGSRDGTVRLWNVSTGMLERLLVGSRTPILRSINAVTFSPSGDIVVGGSEDGVVRLWDAHTGELVQQLRDQNAGIGSLAFTPDGTVIVTASNHIINSTGDVRLWDPVTGKLYKIVSTDERGASSVAVSPNGHLMASSVTPKIGYPLLHASDVLIWELYSNNPSHVTPRGHLPTDPKGRVNFDIDFVDDLGR